MNFRKYYLLMLMLVLCIGVSAMQWHGTGVKYAPAHLTDSIKKATQNPLAPKKACCTGSPSKAKMLMKQKKAKH